MMRDPRWMSLAGASVVAAVGGSADRVFGLRYLTADAWAGYFALYEVFSKFWFIPYVVTRSSSRGRRRAAIAGE